MSDKSHNGIKADHCGMTTDAKIKLAVVDVDGTMTNGIMVWDHDANVSKGYHTRDVSALWMLFKAGIRVLVLSGSNHKCDFHRFGFLLPVLHEHEEDFDLPMSEVLVQGIRDKGAFLNQWLAERDIDWNDVAFIGDAENDLDCIARAGWSACPKDALDIVKSRVTNVMHHNGGSGAVREFADLVIGTMEALSSIRRK